MRPLRDGLAALALVAATALRAEDAPRIVSLGPAITETLVALGVADLVVGRDSASQSPEVRERPDVGYFRTINAEGVLALRPTLILAARGTGPAEEVRRLAGAGVSLEVFDAPPSAESTTALVLAVGRRTGRDAHAAELVRKLDASLDAARAVAAGRERPTVVFLLGNTTGSQAAMTAGTDTAADAFIQLAGGTNLMTSHAGYRPVSPETLLAAQPDVIWIGQMEPGADVRPAWLSEAALGTRTRIVPFPLQRLSFGPTLGHEVLAAARELHGAAVAPPGRAE